MRVPPSSEGLVVLAGKDANGGRDRDVGGVVEVELVFPIEARHRNRRVRQPVERDVVEHAIAFPEDDNNC